MDAKFRWGSLGLEDLDNVSDKRRVDDKHGRIHFINLKLFVWGIA